MIIKYNEARVLTIGGVDVNKPDICRFIPGINIIDQANWDLAKKDPIIQYKIKKNLLVIMQSKDGTEVTSGEPPLDLVTEMYDLIKLEALTKSKNKRIAAAAKKRIIELNAPEMDAESTQENESTED